MPDPVPVVRDLDRGIYVKGDAGPRCGVAMKGGDIIVEGKIGYMSGFMAHAGRIIALGGADDACADSLWGGEVWVAGPIKSLGVDSKVVEPKPDEVASIEEFRIAFVIAPVVGTAKTWWMPRTIWLWVERVIGRKQLFFGQVETSQGGDMVLDLTLQPRHFPTMVLPHRGNDQQQRGFSHERRAKNVCSKHLQYSFC